MTTAPLDPWTLEDAGSIEITKLKRLLMSVPRPQYQIAALAGIHPSTLSMYARGQALILDKHLVALCDLFQCEPEDVLGFVEIPRP
jgi:DNA-binding Xre family transcriptional regulator